MELAWKVLRGYRGYEEVSNEGHGFTGCGKMLVWRSKQPSAAKAEFITQQLCTA